MPDVIQNAVPIRDAIADGSSWHRAYDILTKDDYKVTLAQGPMADDVIVARCAIAAQDGSTSLVGSFLWLQDQWQW